MQFIETRRTIINPIALSDDVFIHKLVNTPGWHRYIGDRGVSSIEDARRYIESSFLQCHADHGFSYYTIRLLPYRIPVGICGFLKKPELENPDFGFALLPEFHGMGLAMESCCAVLDYGIGTFGFEVLDAVSVRENWRSVRLLEQLDFREYGWLPGKGTDNSVMLYRWQRRD